MSIEAPRYTVGPPPPYQSCPAWVHPAGCPSYGMPPAYTRIHEDATTSMTTDTMTFIFEVIEAEQSTSTYWAETTTSTTTDTTSELPKSIVPSDVTGSSMPTILVTDTSSPEAPSSTEWVVSPTTADESESIKGPVVTSTSTLMTTTLLSKTSPSSTSRAGTSSTATSNGSGPVVTSRGTGLRQISVGILGLCLVAAMAAQM